jgi:prophage antirepressor-like protein
VTVSRTGPCPGRATENTEETQINTFSWQGSKKAKERAEKQEEKEEEKEKKKKGEERILCVVLCLSVSRWPVSDEWARP